MVKVISHMKMENLIKVIMRMTASMVMVSSLGLTVKYMMGNGILVNIMVGQNIQMKKVSLETQYGIKVNVSNGCKEMNYPKKERE